MKCEYRSGCDAEATRTYTLKALASSLPDKYSSGGARVEVSYKSNVCEYHHLICDMEEYGCD